MALGLGLVLTTVTISFHRKPVHSEGGALIRSSKNKKDFDSSSSSATAEDQDLSLSAWVSQMVGAKKSATGEDKDDATTTTDKTVRAINPKTGNPFYTRGEVSSHTSLESGGIWVTHKDGVYDISDFVAVHPGGERILLAAGQSIDPFWAIFSVHQTPETLSLLETFRIGDLVPLEQDPSASSGSNSTNAELESLQKLFESDPPRDPRLIVRSARPCNAECPPNELEQHFVTPNNLFFVRNHLPVPEIDPQTYRLTIDPGAGSEEIELSLEDLKTKFDKVDVMVAFQCAGNRRREMHDVKGVKGLQWTQGAIGNAVWSGVRLVDVLKEVGVDVEKLEKEQMKMAAGTSKDEGSTNESAAKHVVFDGTEGYGASIPLHKAIDPRGDVLLAYEMNGEPIPKDHGFPLRVIVPGHVAARSVKWVKKISLSEEESESHWQRRDYKGFGPSKTLENSDYSQSESIQEMPVQSAILSPNPATLSKGAGEGEDQGMIEVDPLKGTVNVKGYAWSGGGRGIVRVDVSADGGKTWHDAQVLQKANQPRGREWAWTRWEAEVPVDGFQKGNKAQDVKEVELVCKAVDTSYNEQPEKFESVYNVRGVLVSAWHRVKVKASLKTEEEKSSEGISKTA
jgi:sulfite oxidase